MAGVFIAMDPRRLGELVDEQGPALVLYARQWCTAPEDVVQEAFLKLIEQRTPPRDVRPWLFQVTRNLALTRARADQRRHKHETRAASQSASWFSPAEQPGLDGSMATAALAGLPDAEREVVLLHLWGGLTFADISPIVQASPSTAHRWYLAGIERLRERLNVPCPNRPANP